jgi:hypothetical protein
MANKKCPRCDAQIDYESRVCHACGFVFSSSMTQPVTPNEEITTTTTLPPPPENLSNRKRSSKVASSKTSYSSSSGSGKFGVFLLGLIFGIAILLIYQNLQQPSDQNLKVIKSRIQSGLGQQITDSQTQTDSVLLAQKEAIAKKQADSLQAEQDKQATELKTKSSAGYTFTSTGDYELDRLIGNFKREPSFIDNTKALYDYYMQYGNYSAAARTCREALATGRYVGDYAARIQTWKDDAENQM